MGCTWRGRSSFATTCPSTTYVNPSPREAWLRCAAQGTRQRGSQRSSRRSCWIRRTESTSWISTGWRWSCLDLPSGSAFRTTARCPVVCVGSMKEGKGREGGRGQFRLKQQATLTRTTVGEKWQKKAFREPLPTETFTQHTYGNDIQKQCPRASLRTSLPEHVCGPFSFACALEPRTFVT